MKARPDIHNPSRSPQQSPKVATAPALPGAPRSRREPSGIEFLVGNYLHDLARGEVSAKQRRILGNRLRWLLDGQSGPSAAQIDLALMASKVYRLSLSLAQRQELCRTACDLFTFCLLRGEISHRCYQQAMLYFRQAEGDLPPGVMSLDQIRTALFEASTARSKICIIVGLTTDLSVWPLREVSLRDLLSRDRWELQREKAADGLIRSLNSWLMKLPRKTGLLVPEEADYRSAHETLKLLGFHDPDTFKRTRLAYRAALKGPTGRFANGGCINARSVRKYSAASLDWWSGYVFQFGITPESCGIADWLP